MSIPHATPKRKAQKDAYRKRVKEWLVDKKCEPHWEILYVMTGDDSSQHVYSAPPASECHHKASTHGKYLLDETLWLPVCRVCHQYLTDNARWAIASGFSVRIVYR